MIITRFSLFLVAASFLSACAATPPHEAQNPGGKHAGVELERTPAQFSAVSPAEPVYSLRQICEYVGVNQCSSVAFCTVIKTSAPDRCREMDKGYEQICRGIGSQSACQSYNGGHCGWNWAHVEDNCVPKSSRLQ